MSNSAEIPDEAYHRLYPAGPQRGGNLSNRGPVTADQHHYPRRAFGWAARGA